MTSSWRYEFKKGKEVKCFADPAEEQHCVHRNLLQADHKECGIEVHDLITGPIRNPLIEVFEDHTNFRILSRHGVVETGGVCKYVKPFEAQYCGFCKKEAAIERAEEERKKCEKKMKEINSLLENIHRIRKK